MRVSYNPQSKLRLSLGDYLALSGSELIVSAIVCRVLPRAFGPYRSTVAHSFLSVTTAVSLECFIQKDKWQLRMWVSPVA